MQLLLSTWSVIDACSLYSRLANLQRKAPTGTRYWLDIHWQQDPRFQPWSDIIMVNVSTGNEADPGPCPLTNRQAPLPIKNVFLIYFILDVGQPIIMHYKANIWLI